MVVVVDIDTANRCAVAGIIKPPYRHPPLGALLAAPRRRAQLGAIISEVGQSDEPSGEGMSEAPSLNRSESRLRDAIVFP